MKRIIIGSLLLVIAASTFTSVSKSEDQVSEDQVKDNTRWYGQKIGATSEKSVMNSVKIEYEIADQHWQEVEIGHNNRRISEIAFVRGFDKYDVGLDFYTKENQYIIDRLSKEPHLQQLWPSLKGKKDKWARNEWYFKNPKLNDDENRSIINDLSRSGEIDFDDVIQDMNIKKVSLSLSPNYFVHKGIFVKFTITGHIENEPLKYPIEFDVSKYKNCSTYKASYPPRALREDRGGISFASVMIGVNGDPKSCKVTKGEGHLDLDYATCNIYFCEAKKLMIPGKPLPEGPYERRTKWHIN